MSFLDSEASTLFGSITAAVLHDETGLVVSGLETRAESAKELQEDPPSGHLKINVDAISSSRTHSSSRITLLSYLMNNCLFSSSQSEVLSESSTRLLVDISQTPVARNIEARGSFETKGMNPERNAQCQTVQSKSLAYAVITALCCACKANLVAVLDALRIDGKVVPQSLSDSQIASEASTGSIVSVPARPNKVRYMWNYNPESLVKSPDQAVGLVNQGATCYMNAFLQQLFHSPNFTSEFLSIDLGGQTYVKETDDSNADVIFQLQVLFGYLKLSQKKYYDTKPFCATFKDYDGEPIRVEEQKDINEFASMLFDKLESSKDCANLLSRCFGGKLVSQVISMESAYRSEREEPFYMITVEVKNKSTLEEALELFVAGERLSGDNRIMDDAENRKVEAVRRCSIRSLPQTLIIHLKRFEFDLSTMERRKINDKLAFPFDLDMFPYTEEGILRREKQQRARSNSLDAALDAQNCVPDDSKGEPSCDDAILQDESFLSTGDINLDMRHSDTPKDIVAESMSDDDLDSTVVSTSDITFGVDGKTPVKNRTKTPAAPPSVRSASYTSQNQSPSKDYGKTGPTGNAELKLSPEHYRYSLSGIVAHVGAIDSGHYYSFIKDQSSGKWMEFNDRSVLPFSESSIYRECFGGIDEESAAKGHSPRMREYNAYLLVYQRQETDLDVSQRPAVQSVFSNDDSVIQAHDSEPRLRTAADRALTLGLNDGSMGIPALERPDSTLTQSKAVCVIEKSKRIAKKVMHAVVAENLDFVRHRNVFDVSFFRFVWSIITSNSVDQLVDPPQLRNALSGRTFEGGIWTQAPLSKLALWVVGFGIDVLIHARAHNCIPLFFEKLEEIVSKDVSGIAAGAILNEIGQIPSSSSQLVLTMYRVLLNRFDGGSEASAKSNRLTSGRASEIHAIESHCHPWLIQACLLCPDEASTAAFVRLLLVCCKVLLPSGLHEGYLLPGKISDSDERSFTAAIRRRYLFSSPLALCLDAVVTLLENFRTDHIFNRAGYFCFSLQTVRVFYGFVMLPGFVQLTALLFKFASLGAEERNLLISLGCVNRSNFVFIFEVSRGADNYEFRLTCSVVSFHRAGSTQSLDYLSQLLGINLLLEILLHVTQIENICSHNRFTCSKFIRKSTK
jgi:ubiquitin C-terminal hydrolase